MKIRFLVVFYFFLSLGEITVFSRNSSIENIDFRSFDQEKIEAHKRDNDYYALEKAPPGLWNLFLEWLAAKLKTVFKDVPEDKISSILGIITNVILWGLGIFAVAMIFFSLFKYGAFNIVQKANKDIEIEHQNLEEKVLETDWQSLIDVEIGAGRFNVAIRLLFLQTIQFLNNKQLINWEKNKTNFDYLRELRKTSYDNSFLRLMQYYNFGWFGDFEINESNFYSIHTKFKEFYTSIS